MKIKPSTMLNLNWYEDADFAGLWSAELANNLMCIRSQMGYILLLEGVPVSWSSKLQSKISLSTTETKYSTDMKDLFQLGHLVEKMIVALGITRSPEEKLSDVFEDNRGSLKLANTEMPMTIHRTKHYAIELNWFQEHWVPIQIKVKAVDTKIQLADIFTKGLETQDFESKRRLNIGR